MAALEMGPKIDPQVQFRYATISCIVYVFKAAFEILKRKFTNLVANLLEIKLELNKMLKPFSPR